MFWIILVIVRHSDGSYQQQRNTGNSAVRRCRTCRAWLLWFSAFQPAPGQIAARTVQEANAAMPDNPQLRPATSGCHPPGDKRRRQGAENRRRQVHRYHRRHGSDANAGQPLARQQTTSRPAILPARLAG